MSALDALLPRARQHVLAATMMHPNRSWFVRDLARHLNLAPSHVSTELQRLAKAGILERRREGHQVFFSPNPSCPFHSELMGLVIKTVGLADVLRRHLSALGSHISVAFVYGSFARGEAGTDSDVDLFVVGDVSLGDLAPTIAEAEATLRREVNPTLFAAAELARKCAGGEHFVSSVLAGEKIFLVGGEDELATASGRAKSGQTHDESP